MSDATLIKKLRLQPGQRVLILNAPGDFLPMLGELPDGVVPSTEPAPGNFDFVHLFVRNRDEVERLALVAIAAAKDDAILWISYPKRSARVATDLTRDNGWDVVYTAGLRPVTQIAIDDTWSALRWRPVEKVGR